MIYIWYIGRSLGGAWSESIMSSEENPFPCCPTIIHHRGGWEWSTCPSSTRSIRLGCRGMWGYLNGVSIPWDTLSYFRWGGSRITLFMIHVGGVRWASSQYFKSYWGDWSTDSLSSSPFIFSPWYYDARSYRWNRLREEQTRGLTQGFTEWNTKTLDM